jgi:hypothetical protein
VLGGAGSPPLLIGVPLLELVPQAVEKRKTKNANRLMRIDRVVCKFALSDGSLTLVRQQY